MRVIEGIASFDYTHEQLKRVADFLHLVTTSPVPIEIATRSLAGEKLFVYVNTVRPPKEKRYEIVADAVEELTTMVAYVQSNGSLFPAEEFGLIAHCDLAFCRKPTGEQYVFTDLKCSPSQYLPPKNIGWNITAESVNWFAESAMCLERRRSFIDGEFDPYAVGIGELILAIGVGVILSKDITSVKSLFFTRDGRKLWQKFGLDEQNSIVRQLDPDIATTALICSIYPHIH